MERTQIYLSDAEIEALDRESKRTGRSRSDLVREAIDRVYLGRNEESAKSVFLETAGSWTKRAFDGKAYVESIRKGHLAEKLGSSS